MTFVSKLTKEEVLQKVVSIYKEHHIIVGVGLLAGLYKTTPHTIHRKLNELEAEGMIVQIKKVKNNVRFELTEKALAYGK